MSASQPTSASQPMSAPSQPTERAAQPAETRGRRRASRSDDEDPLTSAAFSLRSSGPVDGRSSRRSRDMTREQYDATVTQETQTFSAAETEAASSGYPGGVPPFRQSEPSTGGRSPSSYSETTHGDPSSATQAMKTPPYGENYGYGAGARRPSRTIRDGRTAPGATPGMAAPAKRPGPRGRRTRRTAIRAPTATRPAVTRAPGATKAPASYQTGGYPTGGYPTGGYPDGGQQGNGHQTGTYQTDSYIGPTGQCPAGQWQCYRGNGGHRAPYDPREDYRRLTHLG